MYLQHQGEDTHSPTVHVYINYSHRQRLHTLPLYMYVSYTPRRKLHTLPHLYLILICFFISGRKKPKVLFYPRATRASVAIKATLAQMDAATARAIAKVFEEGEGSADAEVRGPSSPEPSVGGSPPRTPLKPIPLERVDEGSRTPEGSPVATPQGKSPSRTLTPRKYIIT